MNENYAIEEALSRIVNPNRWELLQRRLRKTLRYRWAACHRLGGYTLRLIRTKCIPSSWRKRWERRLFIKEMTINNIPFDREHL